MCAKGFNDGSSTIFINLFETSSDDFCTFRLKKSLLIWASVIGDITKQDEGLFPHDVGPHNNLFLVDIIFISYVKTGYKISLIVWVVQGNKVNYLKANYSSI